MPQARESAVEHVAIDLRSTSSPASSGSGSAGCERGSSSDAGRQPHCRVSVVQQLRIRDNAQQFRIARPDQLGGHPHVRSVAVGCWRASRDGIASCHLPAFVPLATNRGTTLVLIPSASSATHASQLRVADLHDSTEASLCATTGTARAALCFERGVPSCARSRIPAPDVRLGEGDGQVLM